MPNEREKVIEQAKQRYKVLREMGLVGVYTDAPGKYGDIEAWPPEEAGTADYKRPEGIPLEKFGVQVFNSGKTKPIDVLADVASHHLVYTDPTMIGYYQQFKDSLTQQQKNGFKEDYQHAIKYEGETRPFDTWLEVSRLPTYFRGYTFNQWPEEFTSKVFTPDQIKLFNQVRDYLGVNNNTTPQIEPGISNQPIMNQQEGREKAINNYLKDIYNQ